MPAWSDDCDSLCVPVSHYNLKRGSRQKDFNGGDCDLLFFFRKQTELISHTFLQGKGGGGGGGGGGRFIRSCRNERGGLRARPRYPGVEDELRRATFLREIHPYPSILPYCLVE